MTASNDGNDPSQNFPSYDEISWTLMAGYQWNLLFLFVKASGDLLSFLRGTIRSFPPQVILKSNGKIDEMERNIQ